MPERGIVALVTWQKSAKNQDFMCVAPDWLPFMGDWYQNHHELKYTTKLHSLLPLMIIGPDLRPHIMDNNFRQVPQIVAMTGSEMVSTTPHSILVCSLNF